MGTFYLLQSKESCVCLLQELMSFHTQDSAQEPYFNYMRCPPRHSLAAALASQEQQQSQKCQGSGEQAPQGASHGSQVLQAPLGERKERIGVQLRAVAPTLPEEHTTVQRRSGWGNMAGRVAGQPAIAPASSAQRARGPRGPGGSHQLLIYQLLARGGSFQIVGCIALGSHATHFVEKLRAKWKAKIWGVHDTL